MDKIIDRRAYLVNNDGTLTQTRLHEYTDRGDLYTSTGAPVERTGETQRLAGWPDTDVEVGRCNTTKYYIGEVI